MNGPFAIMRVVPYFDFFPTFQHFSENVPHVCFYFANKLVENRNNCLCHINILCRSFTTPHSTYFNNGSVDVINVRGKPEKNRRSSRIFLVHVDTYRYVTDHWLWQHRFIVEFILALGGRDDEIQSTGSHGSVGGDVHADGTQGVGAQLARTGRTRIQHDTLDARSYTGWLPWWRRIRIFFPEKYEYF